MITETIQNKSGRIRELACQLSSRIEKFEQWLADLPGRVEAVYLVDDLAFNLRRHGKTWHLFVRRGDEAEMRLTEAGLAIKIKAVGEMQNIVLAVSQSQDELLASLSEACRTADVQLLLLSQKVDVKA